MQQQDDTVDAHKDGTNTDLLESRQFFVVGFFQEHFAASSLFSPTDWILSWLTGSDDGGIYWLKVKEYSEHVLDLKVPYYSHFPFSPNLMEPLHTLNRPEEEAWEEK